MLPLKFDLQHYSRPLLTNIESKDQQTLLIPLVELALRLVPLSLQLQRAIQLVPQVFPLQVILRAAIQVTLLQLVYLPQHQQAFPLLQRVSHQ